MSKVRLLLGVVIVVGLLMALGGAIRAGQAAEGGEGALQSISATPAKLSFTYHAVQANYWYCSDVGAADINGDGKMDLLSASAESSIIDSWTSTGTGTFTKHIINTTPFSATSFYLDDMDADGDVDLAAMLDPTLLLRTYSHATYENQGNGSWQESQKSWYDLPIALAPVGVELEGVHYSLWADESSYFGNAIRVEAPLSSTSRFIGYLHPSNDPQALYADDLDRDGDIEYIAAAYYGAYIFDCSNSWYPCAMTSVSDSHYYDEWVWTDDLDQDGDVDVVLSGPPGLAWWENRLTIGGQRWIKHDIARRESYVAAALHLIDLDGDGDSDVLAGTTNEMIWWENLGAPLQEANWIRHVLDTNTQANPEGYALFPADVDGDGRIDIVGCDLNSSDKPGQRERLGWWENTHTSPQASLGQISWDIRDIDTTLPGAWGVDLADMNGDGRLDVVAAGYGDATTNGKVRWYSSSVGSPTTWHTAFTATLDKARGVATYATHRAQPRFVVATAAGGGEVREFAGNDWEWTGAAQTTRLSALGDTYAAIVADLDGDGVPDLVGTSAQNDDILWSRNMTGTVIKIEDNCDGARSLCAGDIDGDGDLDVVAACANATSASWWQNNDHGTSWTKQTIQSYFPKVTDVACGDINNNGREELVLSSTDQGWIGWFGFFDPSYTQGWVTQSFTGTEHIAMADVDQDGDLDVLATSNQRDELAWFENQGAGTFASMPYILDEAMGGVRDLAVGDISGDGAPDLVVALEGRDTIRWYQQQIPTDLSIDKQLDTLHSTGVISSGEPIPYVLEITNNTLSGAAADVLVVDSWDPPDAVIGAAADEDCVSDLAHGVMTCTLSLKAGRIEQMNVVITPSLLFGGFITNTAQVLPAPPYLNATPYLDTDSAAAVEVEQRMTVWDGRIRLGSLPSLPVRPGGTFSYTVGLFNMGPKSGVSAVMTNLWSPASAITGFSILGSSTGGMQRAAAGYTCVTEDVADGVVCTFDDLQVGTPLTVTIGVTTSKIFTDLLKADITLEGPNGDEGNSANNQTWPIWVGPGITYEVYCPLVLRQ